jgi:hypothetical protein
MIPASRDGMLTEIPLIIQILKSVYMILPASYPGAMCCSMACVAFAWAAWINLIDFVVRRLAESVSISGADCDFWSGLNKLDF